MAAYYNEIDPYAAAWLRNLIAAGHIADGEVDTRSVKEVHPDDIKGFTQCHFFAGVGVWSLALRRAGWPDERHVWTGSCPCQPFSAAGRAGGFDDERHLWPHWHHLIRECRPADVFGEQVASADGLRWLDLVLADMEGEGYAFGAADLCAAGVGAPHIRQRLYWVANTPSEGPQGRGLGGGARPGWEGGAAERGGEAGGLGDARQHHAPSQEQAPGAGHSQADRPADQSGRSSLSFGRMGNPDSDRAGRNRGAVRGALAGDDGQLGADDVGAGLGIVRGRGLAGAGHSGAHPDEHHQEHRPGPTNGLWRDADWLLCRDGKWRPVEPGTFPLAHGATSRVGRVRTDQERLAALLPRKDQGSRIGRLRAYGNAINAQCAETFVRACM